MRQKYDPIAVLISDVHYSLSTLKLADAAMRMAIAKANDLGVPVVVAGDLHDSKANLRGECIKAMIDTFKLAKVTPIVIVGNHCKINEKSLEHSLEFLRPCATIVDKPISNLIPHWTMAPYFSDVEALRTYLKTLPPNSNIIMHQGLQGADSGEYFLDKTALHENDLAGHNVISGHYHHGLDKVLPNGGHHKFLGNPYTLGFGEAAQGTKGYYTLYCNNDMDFHASGLPKHTVITGTVKTGGISYNIDTFSPDKEDSVLFRISGPSDLLISVKKEEIAFEMCHTGNVKLELIPTDVVEIKEDVSKATSLDFVIDALSGVEELRKVRLKELWKDLLSGDE